MSTNINNTASQLALKFSEDSDIPSRFKKDNKDLSPKKLNASSKVEFRFKQNVDDWKQLIETMLQRLESQKVWRFVSSKPNMEVDLSNVTDSKDFLDFTDYLVLRRDKENCNSKELGNLSMLYTEFQKELGRQIDATSKIDQ